MNALPYRVAVVAGEELARVVYSHNRLDAGFAAAGAPGRRPEGNCVTKCTDWLNACGPDPKADAHAVLARLLLRFAGSREIVDAFPGTMKVAAEEGLSLCGETFGPTNFTPHVKRFEDHVKDNNCASIQKDFERAFSALNSDPPAALASSCSMLESCCQVLIEINGWTMPSKKTLKPLFHEVQTRLAMNPDHVHPEMKKMMGALGALVDSIAVARTHESSAHGKGLAPSNVGPVMARMALTSSMMLVEGLLSLCGPSSEHAAA